MNNLNQKVVIINSLFWKLIERGGTSGVQFIIQIILARLLLPKDYGVIAIVTIFITIATVFIQSGFNTALIQKKQVKDSDYSSVFYLSMCVATTLYLILFFVAPSVSAFFHMPQLTSIFRVLSVVLFFGAVNSIQNAIIAREMQFKKLFFSSFSSLVISGSIGVFLAYAGFGVWALVIQQIVNQFLLTTTLWFTVKWRPKLVFSLESSKILFSFGWKILITSVIDSLYTEMRSLIIGKIYSPEVLGFYNRGKQFPSMIVSNINGSIQSVMLPALSANQDDKKRVKEMVRRAIVTSSFIVFPLMIGMIVIAEPLVTILLTDKWLPAVPFLQIYCLSYSLFPIHIANLQAINALGRSDVFLKLEIIKKILGLSVLVISINFGVYAIALGGLLVDMISTFINAHPNRRLLDYSYRNQCKDIVPSLLISIVMGGVTYTIQYFGYTPGLTLGIQVVFGVCLYIGMAKLFKLESFTYLVSTMRSMLGERIKR